MITTTDRGDIMHFAGRHHLSPAVRDGAPALVQPGDHADRCGWTAFFGALEARGLAARIEPEDGTSFSTAPRSEAGAGHAPSRPASAEARRFLAALQGRLEP